MEKLPIEPVRDLEKLRLPQWGRVREVDGMVPWELDDDVGCPVEPVRRFLRELVAQKRSRATLRSYAYVLQRWWRFLIAVGIRWDVATSAELRDFVLWLLHTEKPSTGWRTVSASTTGTVNPVTRKQYPGNRYGPATIAHSNAVLRSFIRNELPKLPATGGISGIDEDAQRRVYSIGYFLQLYTILVYIGVIEEDFIGSLLYRRYIEAWAALELLLP